TSQSSTSKAASTRCRNDYVGQDVWVRQQDDEIVIVHVARDGAHEIARWEPTTPGQPRHNPRAGCTGAGPARGGTGASGRKPAHVLGERAASEGCRLTRKSRSPGGSTRAARA